MSGFREPYNPRIRKCCKTFAERSAPHKPGCLHEAQRLRQVAATVTLPPDTLKQRAHEACPACDGDIEAASRHGVAKHGINCLPLHAAIDALAADRGGQEVRCYKCNRLAEEPICVRCVEQVGGHRANCRCHDTHCSRDMLPKRLQHSHPFRDPLCKPHVCPAVHVANCECHPVQRPCIWCETDTYCDGFTDPECASNLRRQELAEAEAIKYHNENIHKATVRNRHLQHDNKRLRKERNEARAAVEKLKGGKP